MTNEEAKRELRYMFSPVYAEELINALSEPTIPLSVIEKIHDAVDNADSDGFLINKNGHMLAMTLTKEHIHEVIDKAVKGAQKDA